VKFIQRQKLVGFKNVESRGQKVTGGGRELTAGGRGWQNFGRA